MYLPFLPAEHVESTFQKLQSRQTMTYHVIEKGTQRGKPMLVDSLGYAYTKKWQKNPSVSRTTWICSVWSKTVRCLASVVQTGNQYTRGIHCHLHQARPGGDTALEIVATVKNNARDNMFQSAAAIVDEAIGNRLNDVPAVLTCRARRVYIPEAAIPADNDIPRH